ncbi:MAG: ImmA/IrrE family metallo-endopeptidase [Verrucomicrobia bacterium]|nr:ImmA/IrrE family metallo-endopeptidase [Verrucomicrobiota bacterium]
MTDYIARNTRRLRALKGLNQGEVAEKAGISRNAYRAIETGAAEPRVSNLQKIADVLGASVLDLVREVPKLNSLRFRSRKSMTAQQQAEGADIATRVAIWLKDFTEIEELLREQKKSRIKPLRGASKTPRQQAEEARQILGIDRDKPIADICDELESAGVKLCLISMNSPVFFGLSVGPEDNGPAIAVNVRKDIPVERRIFSAAHELGHLVLHPGSYDGDIRDEQFDEPEEQAADAFAGYFLMPKDAFEAKWVEYRGLHFFDRIMKVKRYFQVSYKTVFRRLSDMGQLDKSAWAQFHNYYHMKCGKKLSAKDEPYPVERELGPEPYPLRDPDFYEDRLSALVRQALEKDLISMSRAAEILGIPLEGMRRRINSWSLAH